MRLPDIDVPYVSQGDKDLGCVPACVKMVAEFFAAAYPGLPNPDIEEIEKAMGYTDSDGTPLDGIRRVNRILAGQSLQLEFSWSDGQEYPDIVQELEKNRPVIVWLKRDRNAEWSHSVVIKGRAENDLMINVNDPDPATATSSGSWLTSDFMRQWTNSDNILIRARVVERPPQRELTEFP